MTSEDKPVLYRTTIDGIPVMLEVGADGRYVANGAPVIAVVFLEFTVLLITNTAKYMILKLTYKEMVALTDAGNDA